MLDYIDIYTRLKLATEEEVEITYYYLGTKYIEKGKLVDVNGLSSLMFIRDEEKISLPLFGHDTIIETIKLIKIDRELYHNSLISEGVRYISDDALSDMKKKLFGTDYFHLEDRELSLNYYKDKHCLFEYDELFFSIKQRKEFNEFFALLVNDIAGYCQRNNIDASLKLIERGTTSIVYSIGDKIIKIGKPRRKKTIPYCEYLLQPIINQDYYFDGYPIHVEVTQKVITCEKAKFAMCYHDFLAISDKLQKNLEDIGLMSNDLTPANVGILDSDNIIHYDSIDFPTASSFVTSIENNNDLRIKSVGEYVIIDLDCIEVKDMDKYQEYLSNIGFNSNRGK